MFNYVYTSNLKFILKKGELIGNIIIDYPRGTYRTAIPTTNRIGSKTVKIVFTDACHPVVLAPMISSIAIGVKIVTSRNPTANATIVPAVIPPRLSLRNLRSVFHIFRHYLWVRLVTLYKSTVTMVFLVVFRW